MITKVDVFSRVVGVLIFTLTHAIIIYSQNLETLQGLEGTVGFLVDEKVKSFTIDSVEYEMGLFERKTGKFSPYKTETTGSCFFILDTFTIPELDLYYVITAAHLAENLSKTAKIVVKNREGHIEEYQLRSIMHDGEKFEWYKHPEADVAIGVLKKDWVYKAGITVFGIDNLEQNLVAPARVDNIVMMGFPLGLGANNDSYSPISTFVYTASSLIDLKRTDNQKVSTFFLLDKPSAEGFSGGPVSLAPLAILTKSDSTRKISLLPVFEKCVGLVHGTYSDETGGKFAAIVPSKYFFDTFKMVKYSNVVPFFHSNGIPWTIRVYENSKLISVEYLNDSNGKSLPFGTFDKGNGELYIYDENDKQSEVWEYKDGVRIKATKLNLEHND